MRSITPCLAGTIMCLAGCWTSSTPPTTTEPVAARPKSSVTVALSSVTLAEDCSDAVASTQPAPNGGVRVRIVAPRCQQTTMQLSIHGNGSTRPTKIRIKKVELLDARGKSLGQLDVRAPTRFDDAGMYVPWNQSLGPNETLAAAYSLTAPDWSAIPGGRYGDANKSFQVRVTVSIGSEERVINKQILTQTFIEPDMVT
jgi:hypothetical protein